MIFDRKTSAERKVDKNNDHVTLGIVLSDLQRLWDHTRDLEVGLTIQAKNARKGDLGLVRATLPEKVKDIKILLSLATTTEEDVKRLRSINS